MQLVAYGAQDIYLTGNPMITYFKVVYRRYTNFAMESIQQTFNGSTGFSNSVTALISRNGDLVSGMTLEATLPATTADTAARWTNDVGHHLIKKVEVEIGGQAIDSHYADWFEIWAQLRVPACKKRGYREMIGQDARDELGQPLGLQASRTGVAQASRKLYIPLQFWFCRNIGLALPLIALQYHEVKVNIQFETSANLLTEGTIATGGDLSANLWVDYIYLDTDERRRFAQVSHEYLIEQLQVNEEQYSSGVSSMSINLNFNHPVKELIWVARSGLSATRLQWSNYTDANPVSLPTEAALADIDGRYQTNNTAGALVYTRRATFYEAQGQWFTKPGEMLSTDTITHVQGSAAINNVITFEVNHGFAAGNLVFVTALTGGILGTGLSLYVLYRVATTPAPTPTTLYLATTAGGIVDITAPGGITLGPFNPLVPAVGTNPIASAKLQLNGHDRFATRDGVYFNLVQPFDAHTCIPDSPGINVYSFALKPEEHQPSGTCNFSRIDNAKLRLTLSTRAASAAKEGGIVKVFATNYNVLRVMSGMGGLAYSN
jgi:hypothetical protein